jgi:hypothetical protein
LTLMDWGIVICVSFTIVIVDAIYKFFRRNAPA